MLDFLLLVVVYYCAISIVIGAIAFCMESVIQLIEDIRGIGKPIGPLSSILIFSHGVCVMLKWPVMLWDSFRKKVPNERV